MLENITNIVFSAIVGFLLNLLGRFIVKELNRLTGYIQVNEGNGKIEIVIENKADDIERSFNFVITDKGKPLWGGMEKISPHGVKVIAVEIHAFKAFKEAKEIRLATGIRDKRKKKSRNKFDQFYSVEVIKEKEIKKGLVEYYKWAKENNKEVYYD